MFPDVRVRFWHLNLSVKVNDVPVVFCIVILPTVLLLEIIVVVVDPTGFKVLVPGFTVIPFVKTMLELGLIVQPSKLIIAPAVSAALPNVVTVIIPFPKLRTYQPVVSDVVVPYLNAAHVKL
jgi:hypothetical protein